VGVTVAAERASIGSPEARSRSLAARIAWPDLALAGVILLAAGLMRLPRLDVYTISFPEGIRAEQLLLMAAGYRPCVDIFCNQGPLLFYALYPTFMLFGQTLEAVRSGVVLFALAGVAGLYWLAHLVGGRPAAIVAASLLAISPTYVKFSRLGLAEVPAEAPAVAAVAAALLFQRTGRDRWLVAAALLVAVSLLLKPVTLAICVPVGLLVMLRAERRWRNVGLLIGACAVAIAVPTLLIGFSEILEQVVAFRLRSRAAEGRGVDWNWARILEELAGDRPGIAAFAAAGAVVAATRLGRASIPWLAWPAASLLLLLVHTPLHGKHVVTLIPPLALLAGAGVGLLWERAGDSATRGRTMDDRRRASEVRRLPSVVDRLSLGGPAGTRPLLAAVALGAVAYLATLPAVAARDQQLVFNPEPLENDPAAYWYPEVISTLRSITSQQDVIATDHPYLTFQARRLVPPPLVESSVTRILASSLTADDAIEEATRYRTAAVLLWADKLATLRRFKAWVDRSYVPVRVYAADGEATPTLYVRPEDVERARSSLQQLATNRLDVDFEGGIRLAAAGLEATRLPAGGVSAVNLAWEAVTRPQADYQAVLQLRGDEQVVWKSDELPLAGLGPGTASWTPGQTISLSALVRLPRSLKPGDYALSVRLYDPRARRLVGPVGARDETSQADPKGVTLATLTVLPAGPP